MGITKKIFSLISILLLLFLQITPSLASSNTYEYSDYNFYYISSEYRTGADKYLNAFYKKLEKATTEKQISTLKKVKVKVDILRTKYQNKEYSETNFNNIALLSYISKSIVDKLNELQENISYEEIFSNQELTDEEINNVETNILEIQDLLYKNIQDYSYLLKDELKNVYNYSQNGNYDAFVKGSIEGYGDLDYSLGLKNYEVNVSYPNQSITSEVNLNGEYNSTYTGTGNTDFSALVDYINSNGNIYLALKNIEYNISDSELLSQVEELLKDFSNGEYVKFTQDEEYSEIYNKIYGLSIDDILSPIKTTLEKPMFTPYKVEGDKYYLIPSKDFCKEAVKQSNSIAAKLFGTNSDNECSDIAYKKLVNDFTKYGDVYLEIGDDNNTFGFDISKNGESIIGTLNYDNNKVNRINILALDDDEEIIKIEYNKDKNLDIILNFEEDHYFKFFSSIKNSEFTKIESNGTFEESNFKFNADLEDSKFTNIDSNLNIDSNTLKGRGELTYKDGELNGNFNGDLYSYNYYYYYDDNQEKYTNAGTISASINGNLDKFESNLNYNYLDSYIYNQDFNYDNGSGDFELKLSQANSYSNGELTDIFNYNGEYTIDGRNIELDSNYKINFMSYEISGILDILNQENDNEGNGSLDFSVKSENMINLEAGIKYDFENSSDVKDIQEPENYKESSLVEENKKITRDLQRINNLQAIQSGVEQSYQDNGEYPTYENFYNEISIYLENIPLDEYNGKEIDGCVFGYKYGVGPDYNGIENGDYKLSACMESDRYTNDGIFELGNWSGNITETKFIEDILDEYGN